MQPRARQCIEAAYRSAARIGRDVVTGRVAEWLRKIDAERHHRQAHAYADASRVLQRIAESIEGDITAQSFYEAANSTTNLDLNGMVPPIDFTQEWADGLEGYNRLFNRSVVFSKLEMGKVVPLTTEFEDVGALAMGIAP